jgi:predicted  nucleic acid-binding Zn-ribbon protein
LAQSRTALSTKEDEVAHLRDLIASRESELEEMATQCNQLQQIIKELDQKIN